MKTQAELIAYYTKMLEKVKAAHPGWKGEEQVANAEGDLAAVKAGGMEALRARWAAKQDA